MLLEQLDAMVGSLRAAHGCGATGENASQDTFAHPPISPRLPPGHPPIDGVPGAPVFEEETQELIRKAYSRGVATALFFTTDDVRADYETLKARGVEFTEPPEERPYGIDCGFRDPSGNHYRLSQLTNVATPA